MLKIDTLVPGGQALGTLENGQKAFVWGALPGENVTDFRVTKRKKNYIEAVAEAIENPSPHRIEPLDPGYLATSPWQIMDYEYELEQKRELLLEQFRQADISLESSFLVLGGIRSAAARVPAPSAHGDGPDGRVAETKNSAPPNVGGVAYYYRNKMEYALYYDNAVGRIFPAFRHRGTHQKFPVKKSSLERPEIWAKCQEIIASLNARGEEARKYQSLLLRCDQQGNVSGGLLENGKPHPVFPNLTDTLLGHEYSYSPNGFFQINLPVYELALKEITKHLGDNKKVLDLYAGVGTIGLSVARDRDLTLVELNSSAYRELERNCQGANAKPILSASEEALDYIQSDQTVIVDPPRAGLDDKLVEKLLEVHPQKIIYLSCNPATQARDAKKLLESYKITSCTPFNFFPRTPHLENLLTFS